MGDLTFAEKCIRQQLPELLQTLDLSRTSSGPHQVNASNGRAATPCKRSQIFQAAQQI